MKKLRIWIYILFSSISLFVITASYAAEGYHSEISGHVGILRQNVKNNDIYCLEDEKQHDCMRLKFAQLDHLDESLLNKKVHVEGILRQEWSNEQKNQRKIASIILLNVTRIERIYE